MNPRRIATGARGSRSETIRRTVYDGALRVDAEAYALIRGAVNAPSSLRGAPAAGPDGKEGNEKYHTLSSRPELRDVFPMTALVRPSVDAKLMKEGGMVVTELSSKDGEEGTVTVAASRRVPVLIVPGAGDVGTEEGPAAIRGGGEDVDEMDSGDEEEEGGEKEGGEVQSPPAALAPEDAPTRPSTDATQPFPNVETAEDAVAGGDEPQIVAGGAPPAVEADEPAGEAEAAGDGPPAEEAEEPAGQPEEGDETAAAPEEDTGAVEAMEVDEPPADEDEADAGADGPGAAEPESKPAEETAEVEVAEQTAEQPAEPSSAEPADGETPQAQEQQTAVESEAGKPEEEGAAPMDVDPAVGSEADAQVPDADAGGEAQPTDAMSDEMPAEIQAEAPPAEAKFDAVGTDPVESKSDAGPEVAEAKSGDGSKAEADSQPAEAKSDSEGKSDASPQPTVQETTSGGQTEAKTDGAPAPSAETKAAESQPPANETAPGAVAETTAATAQQPPGEAKPAPAAEAPASQPAAAEGAGQPAGKPAEAPQPTTSASIAAAAAALASTTSGATSAAAAPASNTTVVVVKSESAPAPAPPQPPASSLARPVPLPDTVRLSSSLHNPSAVPITDDSVRTSAPLPDWYDKEKAADYERRHLPEWFNGSAPHRSESTYLTTRDKMLELARTNQQQHVTATAIRRSVPGDAGSLMRMHRFLSDLGLINAGQVGETSPRDPAVARLAPAAGTKRCFNEMERTLFWTTARTQALHGSIRPHIRREANSGRFVVDWDGVAKEVGDGATPSDCQRAFLSPPSEEARLIADASTKSDVGGSGAATVGQIIEEVDPDVIRAAVDAALNASGNGEEADVDSARKAGIVGAVAASAASGLREQEDEMSRTLMEIAEQRIRRLENRTAVLDDVEALLEAERVSLELERRDLYTARCRHWFGDGY